MDINRAIEVLNGSEKNPQSEEELISQVVAGAIRGEKCFVLLWDSEREQIDELIRAQAQALTELDAKIERQERMIGLACEWLQKIGCPALADLYCDDNCSTEMNGSDCWRRWLEQEVEKKS